MDAFGAAKSLAGKSPGAASALHVMRRVYFAFLFCFLFSTSLMVRPLLTQLLPPGPFLLFRGSYSTTDTVSNCNTVGLVAFSHRSFFPFLLLTGVSAALARGLPLTSSYLTALFQAEKGARNVVEALRVQGRGTAPPLSTHIDLIPPCMHADTAWGGGKREKNISNRTQSILPIAVAGEPTDKKKN